MFLKKILFIIGGMIAILALNINAVLATPTQSTKAKQAILIEDKTGTVLLEKNADMRMPTSSMSKVMTIYMVFQALKEGRISLNDKFSVSEKAWKKGGSKMFVKFGDKVKVDDLLQGVIVQSGNDATIVLAEGISGTEDVFASAMTAEAQALGMKNSNFVNASGWPDKNHYSTARDFAILAKRIIHDFPEYYHYFSEKEFTYNGIKQRNRNALLFRNMGVDGIKTGHTEAAGYGLMASAVRNGRRLILVVNGLANEKERADEPARLFEWGFRAFDNYDILKASDKVAEAPVWLGIADNVPLVIKDDITLTLLKADKDKIKLTVSFDGPLPAPVKKGEEVGILKIEIPNFETKKYPVYTGSSVSELGVFPRTIKKAKQLLFGK